MNRFTKDKAGNKTVNPTHASSCLQPPSLYFCFEEVFTCTVSCSPQGTFEHLLRKFPVGRNIFNLKCAKHANNYL